jgi:Collagen triple helix repeat (20 copies)
VREFTRAGDAVHRVLRWAAGRFQRIVDGISQSTIQEVVLQSILKRRPSTAMAVAFIALFLAVSGTATAAHLITGRQIARNAITGKHVRDHSLSARDFSGSLVGPAGATGQEGPRGFTGAKGERGPQGDRGPQGERGLPGKDGLNGKDGKDGEPGLDGKDGINGHDGKDGLDGKDGAPGINGHDGTDGKDGAPGLNGHDGTNGTNGKDGKDGFNGVTLKSVDFFVPPGSHGTNGVASCDSGQKVVGGGVKVAESLADFSLTYSSYPDSASTWKVRMGNTGQSFGLSATVYAVCVASAPLVPAPASRGPCRRPSRGAP